MPSVNVLPSVPMHPIFGGVLILVPPLYVVSVVDTPFTRSLPDPLLSPRAQYRMSFVSVKMIAPWPSCAGS